MRRFLIFICLTILAISIPLSLGSVPGRQVLIPGTNVSQKPIEPFSLGGVLGHQVRTPQANVVLKPIVPSSSVAVTVLVVPAAPMPFRFSLEQNYPNPYNATTAIHYSCGEETFVSLKVYNILGQEVTTLVEEPKSAGFYTILWDSRDRYGNPLASGVYFYRIIAGQFVQTKKLILVR